jgi:hypothetical protein
VTKYVYREDSREISGFGGAYEKACQIMVVAGMEWFDEHPDAVPHFAGYQGVMGIITEEDDDAKALGAWMVAAADAYDPNGGVTGAMHQATVSHVLWAHENGWDPYLDKMSILLEEAK